MPNTIAIHRSARRAAAIIATLGVVACRHPLEVQYPGQIPTSTINDPALAAVLVRSAIGDFECAYSNYMSGSSVHSDEYETSNSNVPLANWGERTITADEDDYSATTCDAQFSFGM